MRKASRLAGSKGCQPPWVRIRKPPMISTGRGGVVHRPKTSDRNRSVPPSSPGGMFSPVNTCRASRALMTTSTSGIAGDEIPRNPAAAPPISHQGSSAPINASATIVRVLRTGAGRWAGAGEGMIGARALRVSGSSPHKRKAVRLIGPRVVLALRGDDGEPGDLTGGRGEGRIPPWIILDLKARQSTTVQLCSSRHSGNSHKAAMDLWSATRDLSDGPTGAKGHP